MNDKLFDGDYNLTALGRKNRAKYFIVNSRDLTDTKKNPHTKDNESDDNTNNYVQKSS